MNRFFKRQLPSICMALALLLGLMPAASAASADIEYDAEAGDTVSFKRNDFRDYYDENVDDDEIYYVEFTSADNLDRSGMLYAYDEDDDKVYLDESDLEDAQFYYSDSDVDGRDSYCLQSMGFEADDDAEDNVTLDFRIYGKDGVTTRGSLEIYLDGKSSSGSSKGDLTYDVDAGEEITFGRRDFMDLFEEDAKSDEFLYYVRFTDVRGLDDYGYFYSSDYDDRSVDMDESDLKYYYFYCYGSDMDDDDISCTLDDLTFAADRRADDGSLELEFTMYGDKSSRVNATLVINIGEGSGGSNSKKGDISYTVKGGEELVFDPDDFYDYFADNESGSMVYVQFTGSENLKNSVGRLYYCYGSSKYEEAISAGDLEDYYFYYDEDEIPSKDDYAYPLEDLSFVAEDDFDTTVTLEFVAYRSSTRKVSGTLTISPEEESASVTTLSGDIVYATTYSTNVQINANDFQRFFHKSYPGVGLRSVVLTGVPSQGSLYYNYYGTSTYGSSKLLLTSSNCSSNTLYYSPAAGQFSLSELTYIPQNTNYCVTIPFIAYGTNGYSVRGTVLISVTLSAVSEVYTPMLRGSSVVMPASYISSAVTSATITTPSSIQFLSLPSATVGTLYIGNTTQKVSTSESYGFSSGTYRVNQLRFVPASNYTGSVELPYVAYTANGVPYATGKVCLGVVKSIKSFSDITSSTWCYKYVTELSDASVISGYNDGTFKEKNTVTYGAALKLIMLAAGYAEQAPTSSHVFSGYLTRAKADGLVSGNVNLNGSITRLQVAQIAAKAMKLSVTNLSNAKPFTDTSDVYVQALNAAGIIEGYFSNGTSTYKPGNTLTRGQISAIVWRMMNYTA